MNIGYDAGGGYVFEDPHVENVVEMTNQPDTSDFLQDDDRWIYNVKLDDVSEVNMESAKKTLSNLGDFNNLELTKNITAKGATGSEFDLGTDLTDLDVSEFASNHSDDGEKEVVLEGTMNGKAYYVTAPSIFVTSYIKNDTASKRKLLPHGTAANPQTEPIYGYYVLTENLDVNPGSGNDTFGYYSGWDSGNDNMFSGTVDGRNHKIISQSSYSGVFGRPDHATFKNLILQDNWYHSTDSYSMFAASMSDSYLENVKIASIANVAGDSLQNASDGKTRGFVSRTKFMNNTLKNCVIDITNNGNFSYVFASNNCNDNNFIDCEVICKQYFALYNHWKDGYVYAKNGLTISGSAYSTLARQNVTIYEDKSVASSINVEGNRLQNATINKINLGKYDLGTDITNLSFSDEAIYDESIRGDQIVTINATKGGSDFNFAVNVNVSYKKAFEEDTLTIARQNVLTEDEHVSISLADTVYAEDISSISSVTINGYELGTNLNELTLPSELKTDKSLHTECYANIKLVHGGVKYVVHVPVLVVTKAISQYSQFSSIFVKAYNVGDWVEGSYILTSDITTSSNVNATMGDGIALAGSTNITDRGFKGIFDGCGHSISVAGAAKTYNYGFFGVINGAALRNITFNINYYTGGIAGRINNSTLENLTFNVLANTNRYYGIISAQHLKNNICKDITINATGYSIYNLLGGYYDKNNNPSTFENCVVNAKEIKFIGDNTFNGEGATTLPQGITINLD